MQCRHHRLTFDNRDEKLMAVESVEKSKKTGKSEKKQGGRWSEHVLPRPAWRAMTNWNVVQGHLNVKKKRKADLEIHQRPKQGRFLVFTRNIYILNFVFFIHGFHTKVMLSQIRLYRLFNDFPTNGACSTVCSISSTHEADLTIITNTQAKIERKK